MCATNSDRVIRKQRRIKYSSLQERPLSEYLKK
jgi:hypothetical protein